MALFRERPELLVAFRDGRRDALECVYRTYVRSVEQHLRGLARARGRTELAQASAIADFLQDVFIRAFSPPARRGYDGLRPYGPYLMTIARNRFIDALRAGDRETSKDLDDLPLDLAEMAVEPRAFWEPRVLAVLAVYLDALPGVMRQVCEQRFVLGRSQDEVSAALGLSRRSLRTAEARLRDGLRTALVRAGISLQELRSQDEQNSPTQNLTPAVLSRSRW
jgi:RNA polymerase sigma factor (sigma-70 family)